MTETCEKHKVERCLTCFAHVPGQAGLREALPAKWRERAHNLEENAVGLAESGYKHESC